MYVERYLHSKRIDTAPNVASQFNSVLLVIVFNFAAGVAAAAAAAAAAAEFVQVFSGFLSFCC